MNTLFKILIVFLFSALSFFSSLALAAQERGPSSCKPFLRKQPTPNPTVKVIKDMSDFLGESNLLFIFDSEVKLESTYKYDPKTRVWEKDLNDYKNTHHEFTMIHLEDIPQLRSLFKFSRIEVENPSYQNDFSTRLDFNDIINIEKNHNGGFISLKSRLQDNTLTLSYIKKTFLPQNFSQLVTVKSNWTFIKEDHTTLLIKQSDSIMQTQGAKIVAGERYDFEIRSSLNIQKPQMENILDLYLERVDANAKRVSYH